MCISASTENCFSLSTTGPVNPALCNSPGLSGDSVTQGKVYFPGHLRKNNVIAPRSELLALMERGVGPGGTEPGRNLTSKGNPLVDSYPTQSNRAALEGFKVQAKANCKVGKTTL